VAERRKPPGFARKDALRPDGLRRAATFFNGLSGILWKKKPVAELPPNAPHQTTLRCALRQRISFLVTAGIVLLTLLIVSAALGLVLAATSDDAGVAAVRAVAGILAITTGLVLIAILATLSKAVLFLLSAGESPGAAPDSPRNQSQRDESSREDTG
jgi:hypothetical protein